MRDWFNNNGNATVLDSWQRAGLIKIIKSNHCIFWILPYRLRKEMKRKIKQNGKHHHKAKNLSGGYSWVHHKSETEMGWAPCSNVRQQIDHQKQGNADNEWHRFNCKTKTSGICLFVDCLTSQQHASVSQGRICSDNCTCCHTETEVADQTFYLTQLQYTDNGPTSPSTDPITPGTWQGSNWSAIFKSLVWLDPENPATSRIRTPDLPLLRRTP